MDDFWQKWQAYSLTFSLKYGVFGHFLSCARKWSKLKMDDFSQKFKAYSLTFWPKYHVFGHFISCVRKWRKAKKVENGRFLAKMASL